MQNIIFSYSSEICSRSNFIVNISARRQWNGQHSAAKMSTQRKLAKRGSIRALSFVIYKYTYILITSAVVLTLTDPLQSPSRETQRSRTLDLQKLISTLSIELSKRNKE